MGQEKGKNMSKNEENKARGLLPEMDYLNECFKYN